MIGDDKRRRMINDDVIVFKVPRSLMMQIDKACGELMISRSAWLRALVCQRLREEKTTA